jgi:hypothetical protein
MINDALLADNHQWAGCNQKAAEVAGDAGHIFTQFNGHGILLNVDESFR